MIEFLNEDVRTRFHLLSVDKQKEWNEIAERFSGKGLQLKMLFIEDFNGILEVSVRLDEKYDGR